MARLLGGAVDVADFVHPQGMPEHGVGDTVAAPHFKRARERGAGLGVLRQLGIVFDHHEGNALLRAAERGGQTNRPGADDDDGFSGNRCTGLAPAGVGLAGALQTATHGRIGSRGR